MKPFRRSHPNDMLYRRIDEMSLGLTDRELAKSRLQSGGRLVEAICRATAAIRAFSAQVARRLRTAVAPS